MDRWCQSPSNYHMLAWVRLIIFPPVTWRLWICLSSHVNLLNYPELKFPLLCLVNKYRDVIAFPGESLSTTGKTRHLIKLKLGTHSVYILADRHNQRQIVAQQVKEMLEQDIQHSRSPWDSPLFLVPKNYEQYKLCHRFSESDLTEDNMYLLPVLSILPMSLVYGPQVTHKHPGGWKEV